MIRIEIKQAYKVQGIKSLFITFPYNTKILNIIRGYMIKWWHPETKEWELAYKYLDDLKNDLKDYEIDIVNSYENAFKQVLNNEVINYIPKDYKFKIQPFKHQIEGVNYGLRYDRFLLGDEQGLGKTMQAINIACIKKQQKNYKHCLIICGVNGLKWNWKAEVEKHSNEQAYILGTRYKKDKEYIGSVNDRLEDLNNSLNQYLGPLKDLQITPLLKSYFWITNIETLRNEEIIEKLKELCDKKIINMIVLDERT